MSLLKGIYIYQYEKLSTTPQLEIIITKQNLDKEVTFISKDNNNLLATVDIATLLCDNWIAEF